MKTLITSDPWHKERLKAIGGKWDPVAKKWIMPNTKETYDLAFKYELDIHIIIDNKMLSVPNLAKLDSETLESLKKVDPSLTKIINYYE